MDATWRSLAILCRERGWAKSRALYELQNGLPYRTFPPGHVIDWHKPSVTSSLNAETGEVVLLGGLVEGVVGLDTLTVSLEVLPPTEATTVTKVATTATPAPNGRLPRPAPCAPKGKSPRLR